MPHVHIFWAGSTVTSITLAARIKHSLNWIHDSIIIELFSKDLRLGNTGNPKGLPGIPFTFKNCFQSFLAKSIPASHNRLFQWGIAKVLYSYCSQPFGNQFIFSNSECWLWNILKPFQVLERRKCFPEMKCIYT